MPRNFSPFFKSLGGRYKRIRKRCKGTPDSDWYSYKLGRLRELEELDQQGAINLFYGDESHVCSEGYVPYGWQFKDEDVSIKVERRFRLNCFAIINRKSECHWTSSSDNIDSKFVCNYLDQFSMTLNKETFIVLDNASAHRSKLMKERIIEWERRGLFIFFLPTYSPHLNIAEKIWRKLKKEWLRPEDYVSSDCLAYSTTQCLMNLGGVLKINFSKFKIT